MLHNLPVLTYLQAGYMPFLVPQASCVNQFPGWADVISSCELITEFLVY